MEAEENQGFTSFDFITMLFSFAVIVAVSAPIIKKNFEADQSVAMAARDAGMLSQTLLKPQLMNTLAMNSLHETGSGERSIASIPSDDKKVALPFLDVASMKDHLKKGEFEGSIGKDPWGHAFHYTFIHNASGMPVKIAVWSDGPDQKNDSAIRRPATAGQAEDFKLNGDDVGYVNSIR